MPSDRRLHPVSILFGFGKSLKQFAIPGLLVLVAGRSSSGDQEGSGRMPDSWALWLMLLLVPAALHAIARYLSFRIRYERTELIIRSGIVFRNERHVPYAHIQNLEAVRNLFHRAFGVVEIRVQTASGPEPEAIISVLPLDAFEEMRSRVFEHQATVAGAPTTGGPPAPWHAAAASPQTPAGGDTRLALPLRELLLCGFIENRGLIVIGALYGLLWELGPLERFWSRILDEGSYGAGIARETIETLAAGRWPPVGRLAVVVAGVLGFLLLVRVVSMGWAVVRLYGFRLSQSGEDLRTEFGLFTRVAATIPRRRIQKVTIRETPVHRMTGRVSVRVETAGGRHAGQQTTAVEREWLAPLLRTSDLAVFVRHVLPEADLSTIEWQGVHTRAFRRAAKPALARAVLWTLALAAVLGPRAVGLLPVVVAWSVLVARKRVQHLGWAVDADVVAFRSGWLWRTSTVAPAAKIQAVGWDESPFDRRTAMARLRVDTAGGGDGSHRIEIPYLPRDTARALHVQLAARAAVTDFRW